MAAATFVNPCFGRLEMGVIRDKPAYRISRNNFTSWVIYKEKAISDLSGNPEKYPREQVATY
jgi:hypothetical protein